MTLNRKRIVRIEDQLDCWCYNCNENTYIESSGIFAGGIPYNLTRMILCPKCGNKRCPRATDHRNVCTGKNDPGQEGSNY